VQLDGRSSLLLSPSVKWQGRKSGLSSVDQGLVPRSNPEAGFSPAQSGFAGYVI
jgi:hypothetical protein